MMLEGNVVLVVDDDEDLRESVELVLEGEGCRVLTAANGQEALDVVSREMPQVILLDMRMPVMNGWQFAEAFRARFGRVAPLVVMTAAEDARERAREVDAESYLAKPFEIDDVLRTVRAFAPRSSIRGSPRG